eukprot:TRINITY_DN7852_c4_g1_i1.p1 TRINITY_DN7852_c4_g1~~TRINITY_DN7852_c4_g1_i1.p1  ORF type:complete len:117 (-),score=20.41 TRINITY_DN7852_c4_g1_i1:132-482(-)
MGWAQQQLCCSKISCIWVGRNSNYAVARFLCKMSCIRCVVVAVGGRHSWCSNSNDSNYAVAGMTDCADGLQLARRRKLFALPTRSINCAVAAVLMGRTARGKVDLWTVICVVEVMD